MAVPTQTEADSGPDLLLHWQDRPDSRTFIGEAVASVAINVVIFTLGILINSVPADPLPHRVQMDLHQAVHLVAPRLKELTQKEPNKGPVPKEVNVEGLLARESIQPRIPQPPKTFHPPSPAAPAPPQLKPPQLLPEVPKLDARLPVNPPQFGLPDAPPPPKTPQPQQPPKLAFETPGQNGVAIQRAPGQTRMIAPPKTSLEDAIQSVVRGSGQGAGMTVGDEDQMPSPADMLHERPQPGRVQSSLQLLSDPMGVDFKPYLIRILSIVRRNWLAIIPESAHMGRRGKVLLQFIVDRNGDVPKLVIAMPSGAEALDRAAVAGISASVPFPSLPSEFKGKEVRLQFAFTYNMK